MPRGRPKGSKNKKTLAKVVPIVNEKLGNEETSYEKKEEQDAPATPSS